jgi:hypothetical protein
MDDGGSEQECLSRRQCMTAFNSGWAFDGGRRWTMAAAGGDSGRGCLTAVMVDVYQK